MRRAIGRIGSVFLAAGLYGCQTPCPGGDNSGSIRFIEVTSIPKEFFFFSGIDGFKYGEHITICSGTVEKASVGGKGYLVVEISPAASQEIADFFKRKGGSPILVKCRDEVVGFIGANESAEIPPGFFYLDVSAFLTDSMLDRLMGER